MEAYSDTGRWADEQYAEDQAELDALEEEEAASQKHSMMIHDGLEEESASESGTDSLTWISWFCSLPGHEYFAEVSEDFIEDDFNLTGLNALVPFYREALEMILDVEAQEDSPKIPDVSIVESSAELLYGLIHQRYILTRQGLQQMADKYESGHFGFCPRVFCHSHPVLPCGRSDLPGLDTVKLFCPNCIDNYAPPSSRFHGVDGAFFGTTFPHLLFQCYRDLAPSPIAAPGSLEKSLNPLGDFRHLNEVQDESLIARTAAGSSDKKGTNNLSTTTAITASTSTTLPPTVLGQRAPNARLYIPRIYGFRVSEHAKSGPRMKWMRTRPETYEELMKKLGPGSTRRVVGGVDVGGEKGQGLTNKQMQGGAAVKMSETEDDDDAEDGGVGVVSGKGEEVGEVGMGAAEEEDAAQQEDEEEEEEDEEEEEEVAAAAAGTITEGRHSKSDAMVVSESGR